MGFKLAHISKYVRWLKKDRMAYKDACIVSKELANINRRLNYAMLLGKTQKVEEISDQKHEWILRYVEERVPETLKKYRGFETLFEAVPHVHRQRKTARKPECCHA